jgi:uncharacterized protein (DUF952 family)
VFSKTAHNIEVIAADFLPDGKDLYLVVVDAEGIMHILQYDPLSTSTPCHLPSQHHKLTSSKTQNP